MRVLYDGEMLALTKLDQRASQQHDVTVLTKYAVNQILELQLDELGVRLEGGAQNSHSVSPSTHPSHPRYKLEH